MPTLLHIGMGKCGSSSLQAFLSANPELNAHGRQKISYAVLKEGGTVRKGEALTWKSLGNPWGYSASTSFRQSLKTVIDVAQFVSVVDSVPARERLVFSYEGWWAEAGLLARSLARSGLRKKFEVLMYVRDPVSWLNSAWWQWGAWCEFHFPVWARKNIKNIRWIDTYKAWSMFPFVENVTVRLLPDDIVDDFCEHFGVTHTDSLVKPERVNQSLPNSILRVYQHYPELRSDPHDASNDFILQKYLGDSGRPDWIVGPRVLEKVITETRESNEELLTVLSESDREKMLEDQRWWSPDAFADRTRTNARMSEVPYEDLMKLARDSLMTILQLERRNARLEKERTKLQRLIGAFERFRKVEPK